MQCTKKKKKKRRTHLNENKLGLFLSCAVHAIEGPQFEQRKLIDEKL